MPLLQSRDAFASRLHGVCALVDMARAWPGSWLERTAAHFRHEVSAATLGAVTIIDPATIAAGDVLAPETRLGPVELTVTNLERSIAYYETSIGLQVHRRENGRAALGAGAEDLV